MTMNPCSKCGSIIMSVKQTKLSDYYVVCLLCGKAIGFNIDTKEEAIEKWNKKNPYRMEVSAKSASQALSKGVAQECVVGSTPTTSEIS